MLEHPMIQPLVLSLRLWVIGPG